jgi:hypothetical protein
VKYLDIAIQDIWLMREEKDIVVYVQREGRWYEAIREPFREHFNASISADGIAEASLADWLEDGGDEYT